MKTRHFSFAILLFIALFTGLISFFQQEGTASYYANKFHNRPTSSGEKYHKDSLTAAHRTLPFGTLIQVTNLSNDSSVVLRVNDRLGSQKRILDVSMAGAKQLNFVQKGITRVRIETLKNESEPKNPE